MPLACVVPRQGPPAAFHRMPLDDAYCAPGRAFRVPRGGRFMTLASELRQGRAAEPTSRGAR